MRVHHHPVEGAWTESAWTGPRCAHGHPMRMTECGDEVPPYPGTGYCSECGSVLQAARMHCNTCQYDICGPCMSQERLGALKCARGHPLGMTGFADDDNQPNWYCDVCRADGKHLARMHCNGCDYDLCGSCSTAALLSQAEMKRKREAEAAAAAAAAATAERMRVAALESERAAAFERERAAALVQQLEHERAAAAERERAAAAERERAAIDRERAALERERAAAAVERARAADDGHRPTLRVPTPAAAAAAAATATVTGTESSNEAKAAPLIAFLRDAINDPESNASVTRYALMLLDEGFGTVEALEGLDDGDLVRAAPA